MAVDEEGEGGAPPLLLISHGQHFEKQSLYSLRENRFHTTSIPLLTFKEIVGCGYGWVVLLDIRDNPEGEFADNCCLWNPISTESIPLPRLEHQFLYHHCILTHPPTQPDCHILLHNMLHSKLAYCKIGDETFTTQQLDDILLTIGVFRGRIYGAFGVNYAFVSIDIEYSDENNNKSCHVELRPLFELGRLAISSRPFHSINWRDVYLVCDDDELFLIRSSVVMNGVYCDFRVFRVDLDRMECREVADIGGRTIFVVQYLGVAYFCKSANNNKYNKYKLVKPNCIYYTAGAGPMSGRSLYIYSLDDRSTTLLLPSPSLVERYFCMSFWVENKLYRHFFPQS